MGGRAVVWIRRIALAQLVGAAVLFWGGRALGQSPAVVAERVEQLTRRASGLELSVDSVRQQLADNVADVAVLQSDMTEVKYLGRTVAVAVALQLIMAGIGVRDRRRG